MAEAMRNCKIRRGLNQSAKRIGRLMNNWHIFSWGSRRWSLRELLREL